MWRWIAPNGKGRAQEGRGPMEEEQIYWLTVTETDVVCVIDPLVPVTVTV